MSEWEYNVDTNLGCSLWLSWNGKQFAKKKQFAKTFVLSSYFRWYRMLRARSFDYLKPINNIWTAMRLWRCHDRCALLEVNHNLSSPVASRSLTKMLTNFLFYSDSNATATIADDDDFNVHASSDGWQQRPLRDFFRAISLLLLCTDALCQCRSVL